MSEKENKEKYEQAGKRAILVLTRCKRLFKGDGLYIPASVSGGDKDSPVMVGWSPGEGFCVDMGDDKMVLASNPLDAQRLSAVLSAMPALYDEAKRLRDEHTEILVEGANAAEEFLDGITSKRLPPKEPPKWT